jgi:hypothetical protein
MHLVVSILVLISSLAAVRFFMFIGVRFSVVILSWLMGMDQDGGQHLKCSKFKSVEKSIYIMRVSSERVVNNL